MAGNGRIMVTGWGVGIPHSNAAFVAVCAGRANRERSGGEIVPRQREPHDTVVGGPIDDRDVLIRKARSSDLEELEALDGYPYFVLRQMFDVYGDFWMVADYPADHPADLLGYALVAPCPDRESAWLLSVLIRSDYRRRGYGRYLVHSCLDALRSANFQQVRLTVSPINTIAVKLYESLGFITKSFHENYLGPGEDRLLMELDL
jgi:ribosomal-protein-alanine N-acetyltransferase